MRKLPYGSHGLRMSVNHIVQVNTWFAHGLRMVYARFTHGLRKVYVHAGLGIRMQVYALNANYLGGRAATAGAATTKAGPGRAPGGSGCAATAGAATPPANIARYAHAPAKR